MGNLLVLLVDDLPLLLESANQFLSLVFSHQKLLLVSVILLLDLHFLHQLVLVVYFLLDLLQVLRGLAVIPLLQEILVFIRRQLGSYED